VSGWPVTGRRRGGVLNITAAAWTAGFQWWRSGNITRTQNVSELMLVLALCLVGNIVQNHAIKSSKLTEHYPGPRNNMLATEEINCNLIPSLLDYCTRTVWIILHILYYIRIYYINYIKSLSSCRRLPHHFFCRQTITNRRKMLVTYGPRVANVNSCIKCETVPCNWPLMTKFIRH